MDFFLKNLEEVLEAINKLIEKNIVMINTKKVRQCYNIKASDRSKINFIWRALDFLEQEGVLDQNGKVSPKNYHIMIKKKIDVENFILQVKKEKVKIN